MPMRPALLLLLVLALRGEDATPSLDGRTYAIQVAAGGGAPALAGTLVFAGAQSRLEYPDKASLPFTYESRAVGETLSFTGRFAAGGATIRGSAFGEEVKGEVVAADAARPFHGTLTRGAAALLERARLLQLQRRPREAIELYVELIERHRHDLGHAAPALVYLVECFQSLAGDEEFAKRWTAVSTRYLSAPPPLDGVSAITIDEARNDLLHMVWPPAPGSPGEAEGPTERLRRESGAAGEAAAGARAQVPVREALAGGPWSWWLGAVGYGGSTARLDEALIRKRHEATLDVLGWGAIRRLSRPVIAGRLLTRSQQLMLSVGTDDRAEDAAQTQVAAQYHDMASHGAFGVYDFSAWIGHSEERGWITDFDLSLSAAHFGYHDDDFGKSYRIGGRLPGAVLEDLSEDVVRGTIGIDRIIDHKTGERRLATEVYARLWWPLTDQVIVYTAGSYCHDARREDGENDGTWVGAIGIGWNLARDF